MDAQRALLDELMGAARNLTDEERKGYREINWDDKETFSDLDRKVKRGRERLEQDVEVPSPPLISADKSEQLSILEEKIKNLLEESLGEEGKVDEAEALMRKVEILNIEKTILTQQPQQDKLLLAAQEKKLDLFEICGSFLVANDAAERTQSHVTGKQHLGYGLVRDFLAVHKRAKEKAREEERLEREKVEERRKKREKENESRHKSDSTDRDRNRERERDRLRERDRYRERSCERNGRGSRDGGRVSDFKYNSSRNGREDSRDRYRDRGRSRSRSPIRHGNRRSSRSPVRPH